ncbi:MAG TPA: hypothetical protein VGO67_11295, partial [Verrucomicrobiae bacterium]
MVTKSLVFLDLGQSRSSLYARWYWATSILSFFQVVSGGGKMGHEKNKSSEASIGRESKCLQPRPASDT